ncbi:hypothetical protein JW988_02255 [Candidatus Bathyarchaeota archaeon]|nr:hypothetical protein [Candidatus Bathyarchaeota archaeon]
MKTAQVDPLTLKSNHTYQGSFLGQVTHSDYPILLMENLVLQTACLKSCPKPISLLLLGKPGIGKSRLLSPLAKMKEVSYVNDITPKYLVEFLGKVKNGEKKFLAIPDFTNCMSHGKNTRNTLVAVLRSMTEEGVVDLSDYHLEFKSNKPVRAGLITATTHDSYQEFHKAWKGTGFLSRLLPFSFSHSIATTASIMKSIDAKTPDPIEKVKMSIKKRPKEVFCPEHLLRQLHICEELLSKATGSLPYRHQIQLNAITEALAVLRGDNRVIQEDIDKIMGLSKWINYDFKEL